MLVRWVNIEFSATSFPNIEFPTEENTKMMVENLGVVGNLSVRMTISNKDGSRKLCGEWPVISIEDLKDDSPDCFKVDYDSMKPLLRIDNIGEENSGRWKVGFKVKVDINGRRLSSVFGFD